MQIGLLHPGSMGASVGQCAAASGHDVGWVGVGRSSETERRAADAGFREFADLPELAAWSDVVISVIPPHAATDVARACVDAGFDGIYADANAIAPSTAREVASIVEGAGATYVDGSLIGPPPAAVGDCRLYLSGEYAQAVASLFDGSILDTRILDTGPFAASALKMCFAGWTKGTAAMLLAIRSLAEHEGVDDALLAEWNESMDGLADRSERTRANIHHKAWRYVGEMEEIAKSLNDGALPAGFFEAAAEVYRRIGPAHEA